jgi:hypothetical protein
MDRRLFQFANATGEAPPLRHWLLVQFSLAAAGWAIIALGIACFV